MPRKKKMIASAAKPKKVRLKGKLMGKMAKSKTGGPYGRKITSSSIKAKAVSPRRRKRRIKKKI